MFSIKMKIFIIWILIALTAACNIQTKQTYYINKDGSGKLILEYERERGSGKDMKDNLLTDKEILQNEIIKLILRSEGFDAWKNLSGNIYTKENKKKLKIIATGYFKDFNQIKINEITLSKITYKVIKDSAYLNIEMETDKLKKTPPAKAKRKAEKDIQEWNSPLMTSVKTSIRKSSYNLTFHMPGKIHKKNSFLTNQNTASIAIQGSAAINAFDKIMANQAILEKAYANGNKSFFTSIFYQSVFGNPNPPSVSARGPLKNHFNYAAESKKAKDQLKQSLAAAGVKEELLIERRSFYFASAVQSSRINKVKQFISEGVDINYRKKDFSGRTPVFIAVENNHSEIVKILLDAKADVNIANEYGLMPLMTAVNPSGKKIDLSIVKMLIQAGADLNASVDGKPVLFHAVDGGSLECIKLLIDSGADTDAVFEQTFDPDPDNPSGRFRLSLLEYVRRGSQMENQELIEFLKKSGAK